MIRFALLLSLLALCGCGSRETGKSAVMADQAVEAVAQDLATGSLRTIADDPGTPSEIREAIITAIDLYVSLLRQTRENLAPVIKRLSEGTPIEVSTTPQQAIADTPTFLREAAKQAVRAEIETEQYLKWRQAVSMSGVVWKALGEGPWWQKILMLVSGGSLTGAAGIATVRSVIKRVKLAMADDYFQSDMEQATTEDQKTAVKQRHRDAQERAGIHQDVVNKIAKKPKPRKGGA